MVRHDPMNNRGPVPRGGRPVIAKKVVPASPATLFELRPVHEYKMLWEIVIADLESAILHVETYKKIGLPGANAGDLEGLADRLTKLREDAPE